MTMGHWKRKGRLYLILAFARSPKVPSILCCALQTHRIRRFHGIVHPRHSRPNRNHRLFRPHDVRESFRRNLFDIKAPPLMATGKDGISDDGGVVGASLLFAGTAVGAGMIALPAETFDAGFVPSAFGLLLCWAFTYATSLTTLEASWMASSVRGEDEGEEGAGGAAGFLSISRMALGAKGEILTGSLFWFLLTAIIVAYIAEGGQLVSQISKEFGQADVAPAMGSLLFAAFFAVLAAGGTSRVDAVNRIFVVGLVATFIGLVTVELPMVKVSNLLSRSDWSKVYPPVISIGILSFGAQNVVPTLLEYLNNDPARTRRAILIGSLLPLIFYTIWEAVFLGIIDMSSTDGSKMEVLSALGQAGGTVVADLVGAFSLCAIGSSMAGASVSLVDFFQDAISIMSEKKDPDEVQAFWSSTQDLSKGIRQTRLVAAALALGPPVILAYTFPDVFLVALEEAGLLGGVSLYGIIPALSILSLRRSMLSEAKNAKYANMEGRLGGGDVPLIALAVVSFALLLPEIRVLF